MGIPGKAREDVKVLSGAGGIGQATITKRFSKAFPEWTKGLPDCIELRDGAPVGFKAKPSAIVDTAELFAMVEQARSAASGSDAVVGVHVQEGRLGLSSWCSQYREAGCEYRSNGVGDDAVPVMCVRIEFLHDLAKQARKLGLARMPVVVPGNNAPLSALFEGYGVAVLMPIRFR